MRRIAVKSPVCYCISAHPLAAQQFGRVEVILSRATVLTTRIVKWTADITVRVNVVVSAHWGSCAVPILRSVADVTGRFSIAVTTGHFLKDTSCWSFRIVR